MTVSAVSSGYEMLQQSARMVDSSSREINQVPVQQYPDVQQNQPALPSLEAFPETSKPYDLKGINNLSYDQINALQQLNQASQYARIGTNMIQRDQDMIGTLLDTRV